MDNKEIKNILNTLYEIEGLAEIALKEPEGEKRNAVCKLLTEKTASLAKALEANPEPAPEPEPITEPNSRPSAWEADASEEKTELSHVSAPAPSAPVSTPFGFQAQVEEPDEEVKEEQGSELQEPDDDIASPDVFVYQDGDDEEEASVIAGPPHYQADPVYDSIEDEPDDDPDEEDVPVNPAPVPKRGDIRRMFTISDKYRFIRELFGNKEEEYAANLDLVMTMHSHLEAEDYFFQDLQWDPDSLAVADFMAVIYRYFNS